MEGELADAERTLEAFRVETVTLPSEDTGPIQPGLEMTRDPVFDEYFRMSVELDQIRRDRVSQGFSGRQDFAPAADESLDTMELLDAISKLTIDQQEVLILRFFMSLPARATGQLLGKNETAVFALQVRAIGALRRIMTPRGVSLEAVRAA